MTEKEIIIKALEREGVNHTWNPGTGILEVNGAYLFFKPDGELDDAQGEGEEW